MIYQLYYEFNDCTGRQLYSVRDAKGLDPIGEYIALDDAFLKGKLFVLN